MSTLEETYAQYRERNRRSNCTVNFRIPAYKCNYHNTVKHYNGHFYAMSLRFQYRRKVRNMPRYSSRLWTYKVELEQEKEKKNKIEAQWIKGKVNGLWPNITWGGYDLIYWVTESTQTEEIDAMCGDCLNKNPSNVVRKIESGDGYDDPIYCVECGKILAGTEEEEEEEELTVGQRH